MTIKKTTFPEESLPFVEEMFDLISEPVALISKDFNFKFVNTAFIQLFQKQPDEIIEKSIDLVWKNNNSIRIKNKLDDCLLGRSSSMEETFIIGDGEATNIKIKYYPFPKKTNSTQYVLLIISTLTESEIANNEKQLLFEDFYINAPLSFQSLNKNGIIIDVNPCWLKTFGYERKEIIGKNFADFLHPDFLLIFKQDFPKLKERGYVRGVDFKLKHKNGNYLDIKLEGQSGYTDGSFSQTYCIISDDSEQKQYERRLKENELRFKRTERIANLGSWEWDLTDNTIIWSDELYRIFQLDSRLAPPTFEEHSDLFMPEGFELLKKAVKKARLEGAPYEVEVQMFKKDGTKRYGISRGFPETNSENEVCRLYGSFQDITKLKKSELALRQKESELKELVLINKKLFSIIAHDLKTPLNNIFSFSDLIEEEFDSYSRQQIKLLNRNILESVSVLSDLLDNLLIWGRLHYQGKKSSGDIIKIYPLIDKCFKLLKDSARDKEIQLVNKANPSAQAYADKVMIYTVLRNLVTNAIKFTERNGKVTISTEQSRIGIIVTVRDTGKGIPEDRIEILFKASYESVAVGTEGEKGTGLGLLLCKELVEQNNGEIWVNSELGKGSAFSFSLPLE